MPRWRPLPEELDPQIREFTSQLRRLVDRSGMGVASIADRTGYSKSSWERYLGGRLLPPRGAAHALAKVTDTDIRHIETMWELAERAWSRAEMRHDVTMEAIRVAQAREALGEFWDEPAKGRKRGRKDKGRDKGLEKSQDGERSDEGEAEVNPPSASRVSRPPRRRALREERSASALSACRRQRTPARSGAHGRRDRRPASPAAPREGARQGRTRTAAARRRRLLGRRPVGTPRPGTRRTAPERPRTSTTGRRARTAVPSGRSPSGPPKHPGADGG